MIYEEGLARPEVWGVEEDCDAFEIQDYCTPL